MNEPSQCEHVTQRKTCCKRKASCVCDGIAVCAQHCKRLKMSETCCICLDSMQPHTAMQLDSCRHCVHTNCIRKWVRTPPYNMSCPMCRSNMTQRDFMHIYADYAQNILTLLSKYAPNYQHTLWTMIYDMVNHVFLPYENEEPAAPGDANGDDLNEEEGESG